MHIFYPGECISCMQEKIDIFMWLSMSNFYYYQHSFFLKMAVTTLFLRITAL